ncbi:MAG: hypothetical protein H6557_06365 [Lewinellaceae bacterium]|nr:hypothetical protein [Phaeodactylibacter sp.]MCB9036230.1 hypothetical protein [Lewinellaceae bacterium]
MNEQELISEDIARMIDILEQIKDVNRMIELHQDDEDDLMIDQYKYRREKFLKELKELLQEFNISPADLAA